MFISGHYGRRIQVLLYGRDTLVVGSSERNDGAKSGLFDEATVGVVVGIGTSSTHLGHEAASGFSVGVEHRQALGTTHALFTVGWGSFRHGAGPPGLLGL